MLESITKNPNIIRSFSLIDLYELGMKDAAPQNLLKLIIVTQLDGDSNN